MRKTLLVSFLLITFSGFAQDWAPFKITDTIRHYSSKLDPAHNFHDQQIQSVVLNSKSTVGSTTTLVLKKGLTRIYNPWYDNRQIIKGQIFGDTAFISNGSFYFKSIDRFGFFLSFPKFYFLNQTFILGTNTQGHQLSAIVDSIYTDSVNNSTDSLARMRLSFIDSLGLPDTSSNYNNAEVIISKNNGMIKGIDFTNRKVVVPVSQYFSHNNRITNANHFSLTTNDEYHYSDHAGIGGVGNYYQTIMKILNDTVSGNQRTLTFEKRRQKVNPPPAGSVVSRVYNYTFSDTAVFAVFESQIIEDSSLSLTNSPLWLATVPKVNLFYLDYYACVFNKTGLTIDSLNYDIEYSFLTGKKDSIFDSNSGLNYGFDLIMIGVGDYGYHNYLGNNNWSYKSIGYVKKGNQTCGTPFNLSVRLSELSITSKELHLYPNPAQNQLNIKTGLPIQKVQVFDFQGKLVKVVENQKQLDISEIKSGIYLMKIYSEGRILSQKFVKE